jgi:hypothetical protein
MGLFTPAWKSKNEEIALKAVGKITDQRKLAEIAKNAPLINVRHKAFKNISDLDILLMIAEYERAPFVYLDKRTDGSVLRRWESHPGKMVIEYICKHELADMDTYKLVLENGSVQAKQWMYYSLTIFRKNKKDNDFMERRISDNQEKYQALLEYCYQNAGDEKVFSKKTLADYMSESMRKKLNVNRILREIDCKGIHRTIVVTDKGVQLNSVFVPLDKILGVEWRPNLESACICGGWLKLITEEHPDCPVSNSHSFHIPGSTISDRMIYPEQHCFWFNALSPEECNATNRRVGEVKTLIENMIKNNLKD